MIKTRLVFLFVSVISSFVYGQNEQSASVFNASLENLDAFIEKSYTPTFDCPKDELGEQLNAYFAVEGISKKQSLQLTSLRTHRMICNGEVTAAQTILQNLLADTQADRSARYYLSAIFQYGFVYDMQENPERCNYYMLARDSSANLFTDIHLSASLGYITECMDGQFDSQLASIFETLETVNEINDKAALAHAYNRVGMFYRSQGQFRLAANQYLSAIEFGKEVYTDVNLLALMANALAALLSSQQYDKVEEVLAEYSRINQNVQTHRSTFVEYFFQANLAIRINDNDLLRDAIEKWTVLGKNKKNTVDYGYYRWFNAELCYLDNDKECLAQYIEAEQNAPQTWLNHALNNERYLSLQVRANLALDRTQEANTSFLAYIDAVQKTKFLIEEGTENMDVANLHMKISNLTTELESKENKRLSLIILFIVVLVIFSAVLIWILRRKHKASQSIDSVTGLYNNAAVINKLRHLGAPGPKRTNALAIFDIANFSEVNLSIGTDKGDFVLKQIANSFKKITRSSDILGRLGPEQFILCLSDIEEEAAQAFFERTKEALCNAFADSSQHKSLSVDSSLSIYYSTETFDDINEILKNMLLSLRMKASKS